jgi:putative heme iron utilization protein
MELIERARHTLETVANAAIATTSAEGKPWNSAVYVAFDDTLTFFWSSQVTAVHSTNIAANPQVFLLVFDSRLPDRSGHALYICGKATELRAESAIKHALDRLAARRREPAKAPADFTGSQPRRVYALIPDSIETNVMKEDAGHYYDVRVPIDLSWR